MNKLIADAGSTNTRWVVVDAQAHVVLSVDTPGINPVTMSADAIAAIINNRVLPQLSAVEIGTIHYYGAGIVDNEHASIIRQCLEQAGAAHCEVASDMLGAARGLLGHHPGIACILGTGSNSCLYNGSVIEDNIPPLGYILGDEGSGAALGKRLVGDLFKRRLPAAVIEAWQDTVGLDMQQIITRVYRMPSANTFLASLTRFIASQIHIEEVKELVIDEFDRFFTRNVMMYDTPVRDIAFAGSVAEHFKTQLCIVAGRYDYNITNILANPIANLPSYHTRQVTAMG